MSGIAPAAVEAAAKAATGWNDKQWAWASDAVKELHREAARRLLAAAVPHLRASIADELVDYAESHPGAKARDLTYEKGIYNGFRRAARMVRRSSGAARVVRGDEP